MSTPRTVVVEGIRVRIIPLVGAPPDQVLMVPPRKRGETDEALSLRSVLLVNVGRLDPGVPKRKRKEKADGRGS